MIKLESQNIEDIESAPLEEDYISQLKQIEADMILYEQMHQSQNSVQVTQKQEKSVNYKLIKGSSTFQQEICKVIAFNSDSTIFVAGCSQKIKIYNFLRGQIKQIQVIHGEDSQINAIQFLKKTNQFVTGNAEGKLKVWMINAKNYCSLYQILPNKHSERINAIAINNNEDLLISCSNDQTLRTWVKIESEWEFSQKYTGHSQNVYSISINESSNLLSSCGQEIIIFKIAREKLLKKNQVIQTRDSGFRICFIKDIYLAFSPQDQPILIIYRQNFKTSLFTFYQQLLIGSDEPCCYLFPMIYSINKDVLILKKGFSVYIIRKNANETFQQEQQIKYDSSFIFGSITQNGDYLITWDLSSSNLNVREYIEIYQKC